MFKISFVCTALLLYIFSPAQSFHIGVNGGVANYQGDLVDKYYNLKQTNGHIGLTVSYELNDHMMLRSGFTFARVNGDDRYNTKKDYLRFRNLSFESAISEIHLVGELYLNNLYYQRFSPYLFGGIAMFHFNPYTGDASGKKVFLQPLGTEGQGIPGYQPKLYSLTQFAIPVGAGIKFALNDNIRIGAEVGIRKIFTDYLDDVSTQYADETDLLNARGQQAVDLAYRGNEVPGGEPLYPAKGRKRGGSEFNDFYYFSGLNISFRLGRVTSKDGRFRPGKKNQLGCPKVVL